MKKEFTFIWGKRVCLIVYYICVCVGGGWGWGITVKLQQL